MAPTVDLLYRRRVRWFSWSALGLVLPAMFVALVDVNNYSLTTLAALTIGAYLSGYLLRIPCLTSMAKIADEEATRRYFVEEMISAIFFLVAIPLTFALIGQGPIMLELRRGFSESACRRCYCPRIVDWGPVCQSLLFWHTHLPRLP